MRSPWLRLSDWGSACGTPGVRKRRPGARPRLPNAPLELLMRPTIRSGRPGSLCGSFSRPATYGSWSCSCWVQMISPRSASRSRRFADVQECTGSVRVRHQGPWTSRRTFGELRVGDRVAFDVVPTAHFWLRLHCVSPDGQQWAVPVEVPADQEQFT